MSAPGVPPEAAPLRVLLVDDHAVVREGYRRLLERHADILVVGEAADAETAVARYAELEPGIVVMDITLPGESGIEALRRLLALAPQARVLMFSMHEDVIFARRALEAGAFGYVTKASAPDVLVAAIRAIAAGRKYLSAEMAQSLAFDSMSADHAEVLSARELAVLRQLARGRTVREIASLLELSPKTVANHQSALKQKLKVETAIQLLRKAAELGLDVD
jgi:DNA-binding NarL/FixJ family response regulator